MTIKSWAVSRRTFVAGAAAVAGAWSSLLLPGTARSAVLAPAPARRAPVVTFYMDRPYLDWTGTAEPYISPAGSRSGQPLAEVGDEAFFSRFPY